MKDILDKIISSKLCTYDISYHNDFHSYRKLYCCEDVLKFFSVSFKFDVHSDDVIYTDILLPCPKYIYSSS